jgi:hypothetical protein
MLRTPKFLYAHVVVIENLRFVWTVAFATACCSRLSFVMIVGQEKQRGAKLNGTTKTWSLMAPSMENEWQPPAAERLLRLCHQARLMPDH